MPIHYMLWKASEFPWFEVVFEAPFPQSPGMRKVIYHPLPALYAAFPP